MKSKVDKLGVDKLVPVPVDLSKLSDAVKNYVVKKGVYNDKINHTEDKIPDITNLFLILLIPKYMRLKSKYLLLLT